MLCIPNPDGQGTAWCGFALNGSPTAASVEEALRHDQEGAQVCERCVCAARGGVPGALQVDRARCPHCRKVREILVTELHPCTGGGKSRTVVCGMCGQANTERFECAHQPGDPRCLVAPKPEPAPEKPRPPPWRKR
jgi:hypothetical protein